MTSRRAVRPSTAAATVASATPRPHPPPLHAPDGNVRQIDLLSIDNCPELVNALRTYAITKARGRPQAAAAAADSSKLIAATIATRLLVMKADLPPDAKGIVRQSEFLPYELALTLCLQPRGRLQEDKHSFYAEAKRVFEESMDNWRGVEIDGKWVGGNHLTNDDPIELYDLVDINVSREVLTRCNKLLPESHQVVNPIPCLTLEAFKGFLNDLHEFGKFSPGLRDMLDLLRVHRFVLRKAIFTEDANVRIDIDPDADELESGYESTASESKKVARRMLDSLHSIPGAPLPSAHMSVQCRSTQEASAASAATLPSSAAAAVAASRLPNASADAASTASLPSNARRGDVWRVECEKMVGEIFAAAVIPAPAPRQYPMSLLAVMREAARALRILLEAEGEFDKNIALAEFSPHITNACKKLAIGASANPPEPVVPDGTMLLELNENGGLKGIRDINNHRDVTKWWCRNHDGWRFTCSGPKLCCTLYTDLSSVDPAVLAKSMVNEWTKECGPDSARRAWENQRRHKNDRKNKAHAQAAAATGGGTEQAGSSFSVARSHAPPASSAAAAAAAAASTVATLTLAATSRKRRSISLMDEDEYGNEEKGGENPAAAATVSSSSPFAQTATTPLIGSGGEHIQKKHKPSAAPAAFASPAAATHSAHSAHAAVVAAVAIVHKVAVATPSATTTTAVREVPVPVTVPIRIATTAPSTRTPVAPAAAAPAFAPVAAHAPAAPASASTPAAAGHVDVAAAAAVSNNNPFTQQRLILSKMEETDGRIRSSTLELQQIQSRLRAARAGQANALLVEARLKADLQEATKAVRSYLSQLHEDQAKEITTLVALQDDNNHLEQLTTQQTALRTAVIAEVLTRGAAVQTALNEGREHFASGV